MTVPTNTIQNVNRVGVREDLSNKIAELFPDDTPFLNAIPTGKCTATKTEWQTDGLTAANPNNAQIQGDDLANDTRANTVRVSTYTEGCPASGINDAIRALMAQVATWLAGANAPLPKSGGAVTGAVTGMGNGSTVIDGGGNARAIGYRAIPLTAKSASYQIAPGDVGQGLSTTAGITVPPNSMTAFAIGDTIAVYNNGASGITITQGAGVTLRLVGTSTTGSRTLAGRGLCSLIKVGTDEWIASGGGLS